MDEPHQDDREREQAALDGLAPGGQERQGAPQQAEQDEAGQHVPGHVEEVVAQRVDSAEPVVERAVEEDRPPQDRPHPEAGRVVQREACVVEQERAAHAVRETQCGGQDESARQRTLQPGGTRRSSVRHTGPHGPAMIG